MKNSHKTIKLSAGQLSKKLRQVAKDFSFVSVGDEKLSELLLLSAKTIDRLYRRLNMNMKKI